MKSLKTFIVDDEPAAMEVLELMLAEIADVKIVGTAQSVVDALKKIKQQDIDLLFLDVSLPDGTGFDVLELLGQVDFKVVFFTAYDEYAIRAIKTNAFDYLMKPVGQDDLVDCLDRVRKSLDEPNQKKSEKLVVNNQDQIHFVSVEDILYCKASSNYCEIILEDGTKLIASKSLKTISSTLSSTQFLRIHQSYLVNTAYVSKYIKQDSVVQLTNGEQLAVSQSKKEMLIRFLT